jgi:hypothetical protein
MAIDEFADPTPAGSNAEQGDILAVKPNGSGNRTSDPGGMINGPNALAVQQKIGGQPTATANAVFNAESTAADPRPGDEPAVGPLNTRINDERFMQDLGRLKELRSFLIQKAVGVGMSDASALEFGRLNLLRRNHLPDNMGRDPSAEEWQQVERHTRMLFSLLTPTLRRRFVLGAVPAMLAWLPLILALIALVALILAIVSPNLDLLRMGSLGANVLPFYLVWLMSLGAIGAIAFIGMNALSVQEDISFDLTNKRLIVMRIALGALFGLVLTLPFGFQEFLDFCKAIVNGNQILLPGTQPPAVTIQATMLVLPFILGFSTSLVILILNRFVDAVQGFFGRRNYAVGGSPTTPPARA